MKEAYERLEMEVIEFSKEDIIITSDGDGNHESIEGNTDP